jgi:hypothetical protein
MDAVIEGNWTTSGTRAAREVETRLRSARRYVRITVEMLDNHAFHRLEDDLDVDPAELERRWETATEFPLLAWSTTLAFSLSTLETYLDAAVGEAASLAQQPVPAKVPGPKIEGHLQRLGRLGARVRLTDELTSRLLALRQVRNALTHKLAVDGDALDVCLAGKLDPWSGGVREASTERVVPTERLVLFSLETVEQAVARIEYALAELAERVDDFSSWMHDSWRRADREGASGPS